MRSYRTWRRRKKSSISLPFSIKNSGPKINAAESQSMNLKFDINQLLTVSFTLFAVIDIVGSIPLLHALKKKIGGLHEGKATLISGALMVLFLFVGDLF